MADQVFTCSICGAIYPMEASHEFDDQLLCEHCLSHETVVCSTCGERLWLDDNAGDSSVPLCARCFDRSFTTCNICTRVIRLEDVYYEADDDDEDCPLCRECFISTERNHSINDYYYKPDPIFYGEDDRYFGIELEIDGAGESPANAKAILDIANAEYDFAYCKHDGSLNDGFEIVTHPMTYEFHHNSMPWSDVLHKAAEMGYQSHKARTCGLHIHVSKSAFGDTVEQQEACIARILYFFEKNWAELLKFSRRTELQLKRWAARYGYKEQPKEILDHAKSGYGGGRYTCVNLTNQNTIEFRIFRGTLKLNTLMATLQLVDKICDVALSFSDEELKRLSWADFTASIHAGDYPELIRYLKERRLYVNEPVVGEEEV
ncbi:zinc-binding protein [Pseudoflavonifractor sp. BIOML-A6]|jgi:hypothetical protein|nr:MULTISPECIES: amidoligase family protein [unclassified Pseudoflavonifractor]MTQ96012.1 zinc-binding protein [Pseudoflavonifractor sp. BIOML-A16]MTR04764.1 zinc-binding protein [Pseudoflavonifractor sp. BIOML-A15]MTR30988.1 zinc-binding protein [Pseudoflavonifractor sp. BIOML-A14]MTR71553.1 zinc-binding protein [Pseudoflavonifractor sp. BIOML-A18]MTS62904.1 zinc-binding protein [Pseudoflavonifractor sp. BIOML-A5]MTS71502.1 zinc-binding protein [Pseudoflavonifractor sp. BIOML-A8]MTS91166.1 